ncbi:hypothetical protein CFC21_095975 [Triticum aestivum]|uniref:GDSL esterase/lipase n=3 Tax=Triticum TaxID=4564 RepID=A0A9R1BIR0_TRITD|nr:hypothetical protein CFC21_095975 [Triticum aestivum]VAI70106.1 unnamed protein product [Triticum turgidum subsp. durum]
MSPSRSSSPAMQRMIALVALSLLLSCGVHGQVVPAVISFGDSTIDVGNNNYLPGAVFKANYAPYGENFRRHKATGRFSDGKIVTDITAETLGFEGYAPPYLSPLASGKNLLTGANFGSAASSYSDDTAAMYDAITLSQQLKYYKEYRSKLAAVAGRRQARTILAEALYVVSTGTGDFIQNYYHNASLSARYDVDRYCDLLVGIFSGFADLSTPTHRPITASLSEGTYVTLWLWTYCRSCTGWGRGGSA